MYLKGVYSKMMAAVASVAPPMGLKYTRHNSCALCLFLQTHILRIDSPDPSS